MTDTAELRRLLAEVLHADACAYVRRGTPCDCLKAQLPALLDELERLRRPDPVERLGEAMAAAIKNRPQTFSLVVRVAAWGSRTTYEASGAGSPKPAAVVISGKDDSILAALDAALTADPRAEGGQG